MISSIKQNSVLFIHRVHSKLWRSDGEHLFSLTFITVRMCQEFCPQGGHTWWGRRGHSKGACMTGGIVVGGVCGRVVCVAGGNMHGRGVCIAGGCV